MSLCIYVLNKMTLMYFSLKISVFLSYIIMCAISILNKGSLSVSNKCWTYIDFVQLVSNTSNLSSIKSV